MEINVTGEIMAQGIKEMRLDKYLSDFKVGTRSEVKQMIKRGRVKVDGMVCLIPETKITPGRSQVTVDENPIVYEAYEYYMLNKPAGVVSAASDRFSKTVVDLIDSAARKDLFPVGRLDKDTEGLLLITNDGALSHQLLSPKKHVDKVYYAEIEGQVTQEDVTLFESGLVVDETFTCLPAKLEVIECAARSKVYITLHEGKFHQIKRMFEAVSKEVLYLKRISMGSLVLDDNLKPGDYRKLTEDELRKLKDR